MAKKTVQRGTLLSRAPAAFESDFFVRELKTNASKLGKSEAQVDFSPVVTRFEAAAAARPDEVAVVDGNGPLTYAEVDTASSRLARALNTALGSVYQCRVGIATPRTIAFIIAFLATQKVGATAVFLDVSAPDRLASLCRQTDIVAIFGCHETVSVTEIPVIDPNDVFLLQDDETVSSVKVSPDDAAYVMFTSGSTAEPKVVTISQGTLELYLESLNGVLGISPHDVYLHTASLCFSAAIRQALLPLISGARLAIATSDQLFAPEELIRQANVLGVTVVDFMPSYWKRILTALDRQRERCSLPARLRLALSASEPLPSGLADRILSALPQGAELIIMYGQTETAGIVSAGVVRRDALPDAVQPVPVGRALPQTLIMVAGETGDFLPQGETGEIVVFGRGGEGPTHGGIASYATGDRGFVDNNGLLQVVGRLNDDMIKIRGQRVNLASVERALEMQPSIESAVVIAAEIAGETILVANVVLVAPASTTPDAIIHAAAAYLPPASLPTRVIIHDRMPTLVGGKPDRKRLLEASKQAPLLSAFPKELGTTERNVLAIWRRTFKCETISSQDNFYSLGGHSLLGIDLLAEIAETFHVVLPWQTLIDAPTPAALAVEVDKVLASCRGGTT
ncbi:non-ribosomal peptide synthetase [Sinorhizobium meliloti]|uniref:non-ribosomal peptide synthetase n=3 Tax=Rhizobium meliloti TaxID=382 RepID=UPI0012FDF360|nr:non-ribosomal peptide synthetase [Sinorhizobium meliloti]MDE3856955.1 non-ribosomal peptide synthetase [Sinorhizobium meliloti]